jgi:gluconolactonase
VYYALADGSRITEVAHPMLTPNGIGRSPNGKTLYVAETETARLWAFDVVAPGVLGKAPFPSPHGGRLMVGLGGFQRFDSLAVDGAGNVCVATLVNGSVSVVGPSGGLIRQIPMPDMFCTNICFGGPDLRTAYMTLSGTGQLVAMEWDGPGLRLAHEA